MESKPKGQNGLREALGTLAWTLDARVQDISLAGMQLETHTRLVPHRQYHFRLGRDESAVLVPGRVVWSFLKGTERTGGGEIQPVYRAGIEFTGVLTDTASELLHFLEANAIITIETRLFGRFALQKDELIHLDTRAEFRLSRLDLEGLAIETESTPEVGTVCDVEMDLAGCRLRERAEVEGVRRLDDTDHDLSEVRLVWIGLSAESRAALVAFLADDAATT